MRCGSGAMRTAPDGQIADITREFVAMDDATRVVPDPATAARYRDLQEIFDHAARDLAGTFSRHRRFLGGQ